VSVSALKSVPQEELSVKLYMVFVLVVHLVFDKVYKLVEILVLIWELDWVSPKDSFLVVKKGGEMAALMAIKLAAQTVHSQAAQLVYMKEND
jgi:hypothetical protein